MGRHRRRGIRSPRGRVALLAALWLAAAGLLTLPSTGAAFSGSTSNAGSTFTAGTWAAAIMGPLFWWG